MGNISTHFSRQEFACKCGCGADDVNLTLVYMLEEIWARLERPVHILSGVRCRKQNQAVGGTPDSQHLLGNAADITVKHMTPKELYDFIDQNLIVGGMGLYTDFVHIDVRTLKTRWTVL